jgi:glycosyltransferase involved in cell wall biosynthesis
MNRLHWPALSTNPSISVLICCHNSAAVLPPTLAHLAAQAVDPSIVWEVLIVDNASTDGTAEVAMRLWPAAAPAPLRVVREDRLGLMHARERGIAESTGDIVAFVDDDNWLCSEWVQTAVDTMRSHPHVGGLAGFNEPVFEGPRPHWFDKVANIYALGPERVAGGDVTEAHVLYGAGFVVRRTALADTTHKGFRSISMDRQGANLGAGGDSELSYFLRLTGWRLWLNPQLRLGHYLPARRLEWDYARRLAFGSACATAERDALVYACKPPRTGLALTVRRLRERWFWQTGVAMASLATGWRGVAKRLLRSGAEGDDDVLRAEFLLGRVRGLLAMRPSYNRRSREIRQVMKRMEKQTRG